MKEYIQKKEGYGHLLLWIIRLCDLFLINFFFLAVYYISVSQFSATVFSYDKKILALLLINLSYFIVGISISQHTSTNIVYIDKIVKNALSFIVSFCVIATAFFAIFNIMSSIPLNLLVFSYVILTGMYVFLHICIRLVLKLYRRKGYNHRFIVIIGSNESARAIYNELMHSDYGYKIKGYFDNEDSKGDDMPTYLGRIEEAQQYIVEKRIDEVYCALDSNKDGAITDLIIFSEKQMIRFFLIPNFFNYVKRRFVLRFIESVPVVSLRNESLQHFPNRLLKRFFDVVFSLLVLIFVFPPILLVVGVLIKITSPGSLFFKQKRTGFQGESFDCYKFRSMRMNSNADKQRATKDDPRITRIGAIIRKTSIDELPQFFNVLKGEMSVVGPRPHMLKHTEEYARMIDKFMVRHLIKPGITGWAQVSGFRGETKTVKDMENRVKKDVWYIENWSFILDIKIIFKTMLNAIKGEENAF